MDVVKTLFNTKLNSNPESVLGVMTSAGKSPSVLAAPSQSFGQIISALSNVPLQGEADLVTSLNVAQLALKHRQNRNQKQRVVCLVGSPLGNTSGSELVKLGKKMKKNNVAVDIVSFGEDAENEERLREFVDSVNSADNSHLVSVPAGTLMLSDAIMSSPMLAEDGVVPQSAGTGAGASGPGTGGDDGDFGAVDPSLDPELAMALRMSLEEERARQQRNQEASTSKQPDLSTIQEGALAGESLAAATAGPSSETIATSLPPNLAASAAAGPPQLSAAVTAHSAGSGSATVGPTSTLPAIKAEEEDASMEGDDEDADLAMALALSRGDGDADMEGKEEESEGGNGDDDDEEMDEDEAIARAIAMSMQDADNQDQSQGK